MPPTNRQIELLFAAQRDQDTRLTTLETQVEGENKRVAEKLKEIKEGMDANSVVRDARFTNLDGRMVKVERVIYLVTVVGIILQPLVGRLFTLVVKLYEHQG